jgi:acyl-homoserine-lactone acylase
MRIVTTRRSVVAAALAVMLVAAACTGDDPISSPEAAEGASGDATVVGESGSYEATIRRTTGGVPHITADSVADLSFGQGWASGEDRACDLADQVLKVTGRRARWLGPGDDDANVQSDVAWRAIGIDAIAARDFEQAPEQVRELIGAYTAGWNAHLEAVGADGLGDWCAGEPWVQALEPVDVYTYARSIALQASSGRLAQYIADAEPPAVGATTGTDEAAVGAEGGPAAVGPAPPPVASNGWAIGSERSAGGGGMLVANPHFPWEGELRFWEVHLSIPGAIDKYGAQLSGLPGLAIGFGEEFGWTHTVSAGNRFTAYRVDLVPGRPTTYRYGDEEQEMTAEEIVVDVAEPDGTTRQVSRTVWSTRYGPVIDFPGFGWTEAATITYRDANLDNDEFVEQYLGMLEADTLDDFIAVHRDVTGVPLFNTVAVSADGRAWYADTSATPNLSPEAIAAYDASVAADPIVKLAADSGAVLLDGSDPTFEWVDETGARDPGLVPYGDLPQVERSDYAFNANDSFWMPHATAVLEGDYSPLHGRQRTARSPRTRENATVLGDTSAASPAGDDGDFTLDELADAALQNRGYTSRALKDDVVARCTDVPVVTLGPLVGEDGTEQLPAASVDVSQACALLDGWDGVYDLDRVGPAIWRELMTRYPAAAFTQAGQLWSEPFDADRPVGTPSGLAPPPDGGSDPVVENLARVVQLFQVAGLPIDATLGDVQFAVRDGEVVPIHGGDSRDGTTNIVGWGRGWSIQDPALAALERQPVVRGGGLARTTDAEGVTRTGYWINNGTSFLMALEYGPDGPRARTFLTYGNPADRDDPDYVAATERFSRKEWRDVALTDEQIEAEVISSKTVRG